MNKVRIGDSVRSKKRSRSILFTSKSAVVTFFRVTFFYFSACTEYGNLKPITRTSPFSERGIVFHFKLLLCKV